MTLSSETEHMPLLFISKPLYLPLISSVQAVLGCSLLNSVSICLQATNKIMLSSLSVVIALSETCDIKKMILIGYDASVNWSDPGL